MTTLAFYVDRTALMQTRFAEPVEIAVASRNWPSLGVTPDRPLYCLRTLEGGKVVAQSQDIQRLADFADQAYLAITDLPIEQAMYY